MIDRFAYNIGDRVRITMPGPMHGNEGAIAGCYGRTQDIPRLRDTVVATSPWLELMYSVQIDGTNPEVDNPVIIEGSYLGLATTSP